jgi:hypothetical protein
VLRKKSDISGLFQTPLIEVINGYDLVYKFFDALKHNAMMFPGS